MSNWWANKLGVGAPPQAPVAPVPQPVQAYQQAPVPYPGQQVYTQPAPPPQQPQMPQQYLQPGHQPQVDIVTYKAQLAQALREGNIDPKVAAAEWAKLGAGDGNRVEPHNCPECGDNRFFTRELLRTQGGQLRRASRKGSPAPICMACGYVGDYMPQQYGETHEAPQGQPAGQAQIALQ